MTIKKGRGHDEIDYRPWSGMDSGDERGAEKSIESVEAVPASEPAPVQHEPEPVKAPKHKARKRVARLVGCEGQVHFRGLTIGSRGAVIPASWTEKDIKALRAVIEVK